MSLPWILLSVGLPTALAEDIPSGAEIDQAAIVDITPDGFAAVAEIIPALLPGEIEVAAIGDSYSGTWGQCWLGGYEYSVNGMWVQISVDDAKLIPQDGYLALVADLTVQVNDSSDPFELYTELECIGDTCDGHVEPFHVTISTDVGLAIVPDTDGNPVLDATIGTIDVSYDLTGDNINLDNCAIGTVEDVLNFFGLSIYDLVLSLAGDQLLGAIQDFGPQIETTIEDAFSSASIDQELAVGEATIRVQLHPSEIAIKTEGARLTMAGSMSANEVAECVTDWDPGYSAGVSGDAPALGSAPAGVDSDYHLAAHLSDEFGNQALYSLWQGGLLCYDLGSLDIGIPLDTSLLGLLAGDSFDAFFPSAAPIDLLTRPRAAPTLDYNSDHDVGIDVHDLGLDIYAELDHRKARMLGVSLNGQIGVDLDLDGATGELAVLIDLAEGALVPTITANDFVPDATADIEANFASTFDSLVGTIVGGLVSDLAFALPSFSGIGLTDLQTAATGAQQDWLGIHAWLGPVSYEGSGCGGDSGCSGGCASGGQGRSRLALFALPLAIAALRRRRR